MWVLDFFRKKDIISFLTTYNERMLRKTNYYNKYYNEDKTVNKEVINSLSISELDELYNIIQNEKTYIN